MRDVLQKSLLIAEAGLMFAGALIYMAVAKVTRAVWLRAKSV